MALLDTLTITGNERKSVKLKNHRTGQPNRVSFAVVNDTAMDFAGGTVAVQLSFDGGSSWNSNIKNGSSLTFSDEYAENVECNSDEINPVLLGFNMTGSTDPNVVIKVYDDK